ncbi:MAG: hypothetical protein WCD86_02850 [Ktedonobacteraceae bacterium]
MQEQEQKQSNISIEATQESSLDGIVDEETAPQETTAGSEEGDQPLIEARAPQEEQAFDWFALGVVIIAAAVFALATRLNAQPATSLIPVAVLSATGCGLLVTGLRKMRTARRPGLLEAGLGGLVLAIFQFLVALSYPGVLAALATTPDERTGFLATWRLVILLSALFSLAGAALGHLAFAPPRPVRAKKDAALALDTAEEEQPAAMPTRPRAWYSYAVTVLLLGLAPTLLGFVFSAAYDYMLGTYNFLLGPFPTLHLLSTFLPWQIPIPFNVGTGASAALARLVELWRIPLLLGNPTMFDFQALEPYIFNSAGLALLLLTLRTERPTAPEEPATILWRWYLLLAALLGLLLVIPADLWIMRGLEGVLRTPLFVLPLRTLYILNNLTFVLNIVTGPAVCLIVAAGIRAVMGRNSVKQAHERIHRP